jgi:ABC-2 type transport system ATP-binding protein
MAGPVALFEDVTKSYRPPLGIGEVVTALDGVTFAVEPGEVMALIGPNRAGKTTLLKILLGLCRPGGGRVFRMGRPISDRRTLARIGYMHENQAFPRYLTAATLLDYYGRLSGILTDELRARIPALLDRVGLSDRAREPISRFSKGMVQRLALAQSLINDPDLLVLDEPAEGLDLSGRMLLREVIGDRRSAGKSILLVSHTLSEVARVCDRLAVIAKGRLVFTGTIDSLPGASGEVSESALEAALEPLYHS